MLKFILLVLRFQMDRKEYGISVVTTEHAEAAIVAFDQAITKFLLNAPI